MLLLLLLLIGMMGDTMGISFTITNWSKCGMTIVIVDVERMMWTGEGLVVNLGPARLFSPALCTSRANPIPTSTPIPTVLPDAKVFTETILLDPLDMSIPILP